MLDPLRDADAFASEQDVDDVPNARGTLRARVARTDDAGALRRWKRRELLRIAARDLLGVADLPAVGRELAALAEVCLGAALDIVGTDLPFAVIGMGKLGGRELNYASDIDVLFVHDGDTDAAEHTARALLATMSESTVDGIVFRTDANLRPEGRAGRLSRTLDSYTSYYDEWAQTWEFQALDQGTPGRGRRRSSASEFLALHAAVRLAASGSTPRRCARSAR